MILDCSDGILRDRPVPAMERSKVPEFGILS